MKPADHRIPFMERHVDLPASAGSIALHAVHMMQGFCYHFYKQDLTAASTTDEVVAKYRVLASSRMETR